MITDPIPTLVALAIARRRFTPAPEEITTDAGAAGTSVSERLTMGAYDGAADIVLVPDVVDVVPVETAERVAVPVAVPVAVDVPVGKFPAAVPVAVDVAVAVPVAVAVTVGE